MEQLFSTLCVTGASLVGKAAFSFATSAAIKQVSLLIKHNKNSDRLNRLHLKLTVKLSAITPIVDMLQISASRGNSLLDSTLEITRSLSKDVDNLTKIIQSLPLEPSSSDLENIIFLVQDLLDSIDDILPFLQLAIQISTSQFASGQTTFSPCLLMRASFLLTSAHDNIIKSTNDTVVKATNDTIVKSTNETIIKSFNVSLYSLFHGSSRAKRHQDWTWTEEFPSAIATIIRIGNLSYQLNILQDFNDGRFHETESIPLQKVWSISSVHHVFYGTCGNLLKIDSNAPVLILKIVSGGESQSSVVHTPSHNNQVEWVALQLKEDENDNDNHNETDSSEEEKDDPTPTNPLIQTKISPASNKLKSKSIISLTHPESQKDSLSLFEYLIRLTSLEQSQDQSHLSIPDETLLFHFKNSSNVSEIEKPIHQTKQVKSFDSPLFSRSVRNSFIDRI